MDPKRVLIVEPDSAFALSLASVYRGEGCATGVAATALDAEREMAARAPDLVVVRAELPDLSGFTLCGRLRRERPGLPVVLFSSESAPEALAEHARTPAAADAYLAMPLDTAALARISRQLLQAPQPVEVGDDAVLEESAAVEVRMGEAQAAAPGPGATPPPMPRHAPRQSPRSGLGDEDRIFVERTFQSIAERRADLVAESHRRRPPPPRHLLHSPEGKLALLREDLKVREAQIARLSQIWEAREAALSQGDQRLHDKEVEIQGLKLQVDELLRRLDEARDSFVRKEREHGASIEGLLLEKFSQEKDLIEVVAGKERRVNELEREVRLRDDDLAKRKVALDGAVEEISRLERQLRSERERSENRERELTSLLGARETELGAAQRTLADARAAASLQAREAEEVAASLAGVEAELAQTREREAAHAARAQDLQAQLQAREAEGEREREAAREAARAFQQRIDEREETIRDREERLRRLEEESRAQREAARAREEDLLRENGDHLAHLGELERESEDAARDAADREASLRHQLQRLEAEVAALRSGRETAEAALAQRVREHEGRADAAEQRLLEERKKAQEELARRDGLRAREAQRFQAALQEAARRLDLLQRELARRPPAAGPAAAEPPPPGPVAATPPAQPAAPPPGAAPKPEGG
ncbi:MAG: response regulator [Deltaproteobacteria bacterium]|nr:response regulator [Deltaproteobacteria bacterium]